MKDPKNSALEERREHLRSLGWSEVDIEYEGENIPYEVMFLSNRPLTQAEKDYALTLRLPNKE